MTYRYRRQPYALLRSRDDLRVAIARRMDETGRAARRQWLPAGMVSQFAATAGLTDRWPGSRSFLIKLLDGTKTSCRPEYAAAVADAVKVPFADLFVITDERRTRRSVLQDTKQSANR